jgi:hypothetical protein
MGIIDEEGNIYNPLFVNAFLLNVPCFAFILTWREVISVMCLRGEGRGGPDALGVRAGC